MSSFPLAQQGPAPDLKRRVRAAVQAEPAPTRSAVRERGWLMLGIGAAIALGIFMHFGGIRAYGRPGLLVAWTSLGWAGGASVAGALGVARGRSMLGRSTALLVMLIVAMPLALLAWKVGVTVPFGAEMMARSPSRPGFRCLGLSLVMAAPLLVALVAMRLRSDPVHPAIAGAALGITAGVTAGTLVDLWCPVAYLPHVLFGHILPLVVAAIAGALAGRRLLAP